MRRREFPCRLVHSRRLPFCLCRWSTHLPIFQCPPKTPGHLTNRELLCSRLWTFQTRFYHSLELSRYSVIWQL